MRPALFLSLLCIPSLLLPQMVVGINQTLDDTHPLVEYNTYKPGEYSTRCTSSGCNTSSKANIPAPDYTQLINGTVTSITGTITIPFTGTSVWVFFVRIHKFGCAFNIDGRDTGTFQQNSTEPGRGNVLGFSNTSLANGAHELTIISKHGVLDFDGLTYSSDVEASSTPSAPSALPSTPSTLSSPAISRKRDAAIIGSVVGGFLLILSIVLAVSLLWRRRRRERTINLAVQQPFPMDIKEKLPLTMDPVEPPAAILRRSVHSGGRSISRSPPPAYISEC
ncbi:hypothetical protein DFH06DRAFT_689960 [Mycena polygramma]|nr:hypothetical protein DFH06DRAFT_689960 [Mycena polygramma]